METLPPEVYSQIVGLLRPHTNRLPRHILPVEIPLSHVSSSWRSLALSDTKSWELIEIFSPNTLPRALAYAERSGNAAVYLRVDLYDYEARIVKVLRRLRILMRFGPLQMEGIRRESEERITHSHQNFLKALKALLARVGHRCKSILVFTYRESTATELAGSLQGIDAPLLQSINVEVNEVAYDEEETAKEWKTPEEQKPLLPIRIFDKGAESLRTLSLEAPALPPLPNITTLSLHNATAEWLSLLDFMAIAREATSLQNLSLSSKSALGYSKHTSWPLHENAPAVCIPSLRALKVSDEYPGITVKALLTIDAPGLTSLWVRGTASNLRTFFDSPQIKNATETGGKFPRLEYLTLEFFDMSETPLFASAFPTITHLRLPYFLTFFSARFGSDMSVKPDGTFWWPLLKVLVLEIQKGGNGSLHMTRLKEAMCRIVNARGRMKGVSVPMILGDRDVCDVLRGSDLLNEVEAFEEFNLSMDAEDRLSWQGAKETQTEYREPWWLLSLERTMDRVGMR